MWIQRQHYWCHSNLYINVKNVFNISKFCSGMFLDIGKSFDTADHKLLLSKLAIYGGRTIPWKLLQSHLEGSRQVVRVGSKSSSEMIKKGEVYICQWYAVLKLNELIISNADDTALLVEDNNWVKINQLVFIDM